MTLFRHGIIRALRVIAIGVCAFAANAAAAEFCALTVDIIGTDGHPARLTPVRLIDPSGKTVFDKEVEGSSVKICDFGFGPHTLMVGYRHCYPVSIPNLVLRLDEPLRLVVRLNQCARDGMRDNVCLVYLRVHDPSGSPVENAVVVSSSDAPRTDSFGRVMNYVLTGTSIIVIRAPGFLEANIPLTCMSTEEIDKEITLNRAKP